MKRALITGNAGFVGSHFQRYLNLHDWSVDGIDLFWGSDARRFFLNNTSAGCYDLVIHCAAIVGGRKTIDGAPLALASNLELDAGLFQWALRSRPGRVVYFSSSAAYPIAYQRNNFSRLREDMINLDLLYQGLPDQLYGWAKLTGENLALRARQEGLNVSVVRPFSGYGERQDAAYPFPAFIDRALRREDPFQIWGSGRQVRDFIHIDDIVNATMTMVDNDIDGPVNLGCGNATAMGVLAEMICERAGYKPEFAMIAAAPTGVNYRVCNPEKMLEFYAPVITLEEGIDRALEYRA